MSYESRAYDNEHGNPVVVLVATGTHDVSRLVNLLNSGNCEQVSLAATVLRQVRRHNGGRAALQMLAAHGGPDFLHDDEPAGTWLDVAVERFGEPRIAFPEPRNLGHYTRRCWVWFVDGQNFNIALDVEGSRVHTSAGSPGRRVELYTNGEPADAEIRGLCECAWPGYRAEAAA